MLGVITIVALVGPATARVALAKNNGDLFKTTMEIRNEVTLDGKQLKPGSYDVKVDGSTVTFLHGGKAVAEAPVQWKDESGKSRDSKIVADSGAVKEIHFIGKTRYVEIAR
jgi:hypothetical protein